jgi:hypothetical protein
MVGLSFVDTESDTQDSTGGVVALLVLFQAIVAIIAVAYVGFGRMSAASCGSDCDFNAVNQANGLMLLGSACLLVCIAGALVIFRRRRWRNWSIAAAGIALTIALGAVCWNLEMRAFGL